MKLRITATWEYEPDPSDYPTDDPQEWGNIDLDELVRRPHKLPMYYPLEDATFTGEVVK